MDVKLPRLGEGADSGTVASILVKEGDQIKKDQAILELESEKAVATIPAPAAGTVTRIHVKEGDEIKVGRLIVTLSTDGGAVAAPPPGRTEPAPEPARQPVQNRPPVAPVQHQPAQSAGPVAFPEVYRSQSGAPPPASPTIRGLARDLGIDLTRVTGSERGGRIVMADLREYIQQLQSYALQPRSSQSPAPTAKTAPVSIDFSKWGSVDRRKMTTLRKAISTKMVESWTTVPHVTQFDDADITDLLALRKKHGPAYEKKKAHLTLTPLIMKALVAALKAHPKLNASLDEATDEIVFKNYYNIGIAVDTEQGLIVPVIRDVDRKSLLDLARELEELAARTRERKVSLEEMQGGTFTISNQGGIGGAHFTPIINKPEVAILGLGRGAVRAVVQKNTVTRRTLLPLGLSYDHRVIDGGDAARFITDLVGCIQGFKEADVRLSK